MAKRQHPQRQHHWISAGLTRNGKTITRHYTVTVVTGTRQATDEDGKPKADPETGEPVMENITRLEPHSEVLHHFDSISQARRYMRVGSAGK